MTTTRFVSPSLPHRVLSRLSFAVFTKGFSRIFLSPIFPPGSTIFYGIIFTYICLYLLFFILHSSAVSFVLSNSTYQFVCLFFRFFLFSLYEFGAIHRNLFDLNFGSIEDSSIGSRSISFLLRFFILFCLFVFFFFLSFSRGIRYSILDRPSTHDTILRREITCSTTHWRCSRSLAH